MILFASPSNLKSSVKEGEITIYAEVKDLEDKVVRSILEGEVKKILPRHRFDFHVEEDKHDWYFLNLMD